MAATLLEAWLGCVRRKPEVPALIDAAGGRIWSRAELGLSAEEWLRGQAAQLAGGAVAFAESNGAGWMRIFLGTLLAQAVAVPLDPAEPPEAQRAQAEAAGADFLWRDDHLEAIRSRRRPARDARRLVKLTSGSQGAPRALPFTDRQMLADGRHICATMRIGPNDLNLGLILFGHSYGLGNLIVPLLRQGTAIVSGVPPLPHAIAAAVERWKPTVFPAVPALLRALAESDVPAGRLASLRTIVSAGSALPPEIARAFWERFGLKIHNFYGSTETGGICYDRTGRAALESRGVGRPMRGVRLVFGRGRRFTVEGPAVYTIGNRRAARGIGRHSPADFGRLGGRGELVLLGRAGRLVKIGGRRLDLSEVEQALRRLPGVRDAFAIAEGEAVAAALAGKISAQRARAELRRRLASWKIPRRLMVLAELPLTARGKIDTRRLTAALRGASGSG
jgi:long-chain acyl-CoA synthetase